MTTQTIEIRCPDSEVSMQFLQGMADRMGVSFHKYGKVADAYPIHVDAIDSLMQRLRKYRETGNTEWLMDVANFAMIEFMCPAHDNAHYAPTDSDQSPGRAVTHGDRLASNAELKTRTE
jgi:hypothetical protein